MRRGRSRSEYRMRRRWRRWKEEEEEEKVVAAAVNEGMTRGKEWRRRSGETTGLIAKRGWLAKPGGLALARSLCLFGC